MADGVTLASTLTDIGSVISGIFGFAGSFVENLVENPLTLTILGVAFIGAALAFVLRLVRSC